MCSNTNTPMALTMRTPSGLMTSMPIGRVSAANQDVMRKAIDVSGEWPVPLSASLHALLLPLVIHSIQSVGRQLIEHGPESRMTPGSTANPFQKRQP